VCVCVCARVRMYVCRDEDDHAFCMYTVGGAGLFYQQLDKSCEILNQMLCLLTSPGSSSK
jgi:hypothetical protein